MKSCDTSIRDGLEFHSHSPLQFQQICSSSLVAVRRVRGEGGCRRGSKVAGALSHGSRPPSNTREFEYSTVPTTVQGLGQRRRLEDLRLVPLWNPFGKVGRRGRTRVQQGQPRGSRSFSLVKWKFKQAASEK